MYEHAFSKKNLEAKRVTGVRKIAVLMAKALGDFIVTLPALSALRQAYPNAEIVLLGRPWLGEFILARPSPVDRFVSVPIMPGVRDELDKSGIRVASNPSELESFFAEMDRENFDIVIHLQGDGGSVNPFIKKFNARLTVGMRNEGAEPIDRSIPYDHYQHEVLRSLEIVSLVGAGTSEIQPRIVSIDQDIIEGKKFLDSKDGRGDYVLMHPGSSDVRRNWPPEKFAETANVLITRGLPVILTGTAREKNIVRSVFSGIVRKDMAIDASGEVGLNGLIGLMCLTNLVISNDTGPLHLARALAVPSVGIYWLPNLVNWGPLTRKLNRTAISFELRCPNCGIIPAWPWPFEPSTEVCSHQASFVSSVPVSTVLSGAFSLLRLKS